MFKKLTTKAFLILFSTLFLSYTLVISVNRVTIDPYSDFYDCYNYLISPILLAITAVSYCFVNNSIFRIFNEKKLYLYVFCTAFLYQLLSYGLGYGFFFAFLLTVPICQCLYFFLEHKYKLKIFIANISIFIFIILGVLYLDSLARELIISADLILEGVLLSYFGIFHFLYILLNLKTFAKPDKEIQTAL